MVNAETIMRYGFSSSLSGFVLHYHHVIPIYNDLWSLLKSTDNLKVIDLRRRNMLASYVSLKISELNELYVSSVVVNNVVTLTLNVHSLLQYFKDTDKFIFEHNWSDSMLVNYEYLSSNFQACMDEVYDYLGVETCMVKQKICKMETRPLHEIINNYDDVVVAIKDSPWCYLIEEFFL
jgi:hypothetical protein